MGRAPAATDHPAVVVGTDAELEHDRAVVLLELLDGDRLWVIDEERARNWLARGAQPSNTVRKLLRIQGIETRTG